MTREAMGKIVEALQEVARVKTEDYFRGLGYKAWILPEGQYKHLWIQKYQEMRRLVFKKFETKEIHI